MLSARSNARIDGLVVVALFLCVNVPDTEDSPSPETRLSLRCRMLRLDCLGLAFLVDSCLRLLSGLESGMVHGVLDSCRVISLLVVAGIFGVALWVNEWALGAKAVLPPKVFGEQSIPMKSVFLCFSQESSVVICLPNQREQSKLAYSS